MGRGRGGLEVGRGRGGDGTDWIYHQVLPMRGRLWGFGVVRMRVFLVVGYFGRGGGMDGGAGGGKGGRMKGGKRAELLISRQWLI